MNARSIIGSLLLVVSLASCASTATVSLPRCGPATWYGEPFRGQLMANGQPYNPDAFTCATYAWPLGTRLLVSYGGREIEVTVTDRGPIPSLKRLIDLSPAAFAQLSPLSEGVIYVRATSLR